MADTLYGVREDGGLAFWRVEDYRGNTLGTGAADTVHRARVEALTFAALPAREFDAAEHDVAIKRAAATQARSNATAVLTAFAAKQEARAVAERRTLLLIAQSLVALEESYALLNVAPRRWNSMQAKPAATPNVAAAARAETEPAL